ncbi:hypothetical protein GCM10022225_58480 [Plantactinospora mayteni]|uniref:Lipoprotein n=1 Tax=Plantactinospora mayteni TaxID=566021 RepID=A0ABQ4F2F1_9ACTN|nr:hypothetical protein [Plantactinospora mayteni]GIH01068.1 hypothetical protein Pma05_76400 [Plantactinospora mayteni]
MRARRWTSLVVLPVLAACATLLGCDRQDEQERPSQAETLRAYQPRFEELRRRLVQVGSVLPAGKVGRDGCQAPAPPDPAFTYRTGDEEQDGNTAEVFMERSLTEPDTRLHWDRSFQYGDTLLLDALHWTGPRGPLGENRFELGPPPNYWDEGDDRELRAKMDRALDTPYLVVLRVRAYTPPTSQDGPTEVGFVASVELDGFVVDLRQPKLLCSFGAAGRYSALHVVNIRPGETWGSRVYEELQGSAGRRIAEKLESLTGGSADPPQTTTAWQ